MLYVKTNVPTAMMIAESVNNVFGRTVNPRNRDLTSGGSSGGESALIAFGGSRLGVGTDIGNIHLHSPFISLYKRFSYLLFIVYRRFSPNSSSMYRNLYHKTLLGPISKFPNTLRSRRPRSRKQR